MGFAQMTTTFDVANAADLANATAAISIVGASAAGNTACTFNFQNGFTLDRQLAPVFNISSARNLTRPPTAFPGTRA
jgi:hypothetical protein